MYTPDITLEGQTYALQSQRTNSSVRSDASQPVSEPNTLTISHEKAKNGRVSSAVILDDTKIVSTAGATIPVADTVKVLLKIQYNPVGGRIDNDTVVENLVAQIVAFASNASNIDKLLNQES